MATNRALLASILTDARFQEGGVGTDFLKLRHAELIFGERNRERVVRSFDAGLQIDDLLAALDVAAEVAFHFALRGEHSVLVVDQQALQRGVLRADILAAVAKEESHAPIPNGLTLKVTVRKVMPTHPTMKQQLDDPSLSPVRTRYLGGADLVGELRDSKQQVLATVSYRNFADVLPAGSPSLDPWADARLAIDRFTAKLAATWDRLPTPVAR